MLFEYVLYGKTGAVEDSLIDMPTFDRVSIDSSNSHRVFDLENSQSLFRCCRQQSPHHPQFGTRYRGRKEPQVNVPFEFKVAGFQIADPTEYTLVFGPLQPLQRRPLIIELDSSNAGMLEQALNDGEDSVS